MLNIENTEACSYFDEKRGDCDFGTLDNIPDFALSTMSQLYNYLIRPFERSYGVVIYGPLELDEERATWGRHVSLPSGEMLQIRFAPVCMLHTGYDGLAMISVKLTTLRGCNVKTCVMFPPEGDLKNPASLVKRMNDPLAPRGLHLLMIAFFRRHDSSIGLERENTSSWTIDPSGYGSVRSTTISLTNCVPLGTPATCKKVRRGDFFTFNHTNSIQSTPGTSPFIIAGELIDTNLPDCPRRPSEPMNPKEYDKISQTALSGVMEADFETGASAIAASISICELLSGEGIISMLSNDFFKATLPTKLKTPTGMGLIIVMAVRIAMVPGIHGLRAGTLCDQSACAELRTMFESQLAPMAFLKNKWAIDIIMLLGRAEARLKCKRNDNAAFDMQMNDQLVYWHRVGQGVISSLFGFNTNLDTMPPYLDTGHGSPWRFCDPLITARDTKLVELGANHNNARDPARINFSPLWKRRITLIKLLVNTERYIRTGVFEGKRLMPENENNGEPNLPDFDQDTLNELFFPQVKSQIQNGETPEFLSSDDLKKKLSVECNMAAVRQVIGDTAEALYVGPVVHFKHRVGAYLISDFQKSPCADCKRPVHVLQGVVMAFAFGECLNCHAKRCLDCSAKYNIPDMVKKHSLAGNKETVWYSAQCNSCNHVEMGLTSPDDEDTNTCNTCT